MAFDSRAKIVSAKQAAARAEEARNRGWTVVFTNGCFDLIHAGHVRYLGKARQLGDMLVLGLNSDASVRSLGKGPDRPITPQDQRAEVAAGLMAVDLVVIFNESTPAELIKEIQPQVLVKGGDWPPDSIVGADTVQARGGKVLSIPLVEGVSTTAIAQRIRQSGD